MILGLLAHLAVTATLAAPAAVERPARAVAQGQLRSAGERTPVAGARIIATARRGLQWQRSAVSGPDGRFVLEDLPSHDFNLVIVAAGHQRLEQPTPASFWRRRKPPVIYLQPAGAGGYRTIVQQERVTRPSATSTRLSPEEIANLPGSQGDPLRALQNLPGVARVPGGLGLLILRGAAPNQSQVFFGEHPLPRAFHIPGLASVVQPGVLQGLEYVPGNFSAHYGNAVGGLVHLTPRVGRRDGVHGHAKLDITSAGALVEGPFGKGGSVLLAAQTGYLDLVLRSLPEDVTRGDLVSPRYHDYQFIIDHPAGRGATITARLLGGKDTLNMFWGGAERHLFSSMQNGFHRVDLAYRKRHGSWDFLLAPAVRLDRTINSTDSYQRRRSDVVGLLRAEASVRPVKPLHITLGLDTQLDRYTTQLNISYIENPVDDSGRDLLTTTGLYLSSQLDVGRFALIAGARFNAFTGAENHALAFDPRLLLRYTPHPRVRIQLAAGVYSQPSLRRSILSSGFISPDNSIPTDSFLFPKVVLPGALRFLDPQLEFEPTGRIGAMRATQYSANLHLDLTDSLDLEATLFYRQIRGGLPPLPPGTAIPGPTPPQNDSAALAIGSATHGVEVMLRHDLTARLYGWLAYTWMRSTAHITFFDHVDRRPADFDQRHNLVMLVGYKLPRRWSIAARFRLVTGLPYTPYVGSFEGVQGDPIPIIGAANSARMPVFHQLDLRIDRTWILHRSIVAAYLDVQNLYNRQNAEGVLYSLTYASTRAVVGLPILPILGLKVSF
ncbi:TonB-dependent receptor plug domain-containing protein [Nannocystis pusilla]|uniref:TonB-dependent receptor plug domain-containing protein n=1 Tax=Nannocystis pusilla TaxID=889268 RepID=A0ABS7TJW1_9BACT|nr:TonB-dependent receptor [Nannocystis pusilla]MBZ5708489.1 TonB-dependent receptor plug domain-containing protein [Nannocystis pusilla]